jgi:molybdopterin/thiamine biosynthesis adenylyltransferase
MRIAQRFFPKADTNLEEIEEEIEVAEPLFDSGYSVFDTVLEKIQKSVGSIVPESGGALLGSYGNSLIVDFLFDSAAETTGVSYVPSLSIAERVRTEELNRNLQFKGIVHSHPGSFDKPSGPDEFSFGAGLEANPELSRYLAPIVTLEPGASAANKIDFNGMWISFYVATRRKDEKVRVSPTMPKIIHFGRDVRNLAKSLKIEDPDFFPTDSNDMYSVSAQLKLSERSSIVLAASGSYPELPPLALHSDSLTGETRQLHLRWNIMVDPEKRLADALSDPQFCDPDGPKYVTYGTNGKLLSTRSSVSPELNLDPVLVGESLLDFVSNVSEGLFARSRGILTDRMTTSHVLIAGCGSVGSYVAEHFVRSGIGEITLLDPDQVDYSNLSRANFKATDVGRPKVEALAERLLSISPTLKIHLIQKTLQELRSEELEQVMTSLQLVVSALDDRRAQLQINQWAYWHKVPAVFIGAFAKAHAGEVAVVDSPSPCFACATVFREHISISDQGTHDYGVGRLVAEVALAADIQSISAIGIRLGLSCLMKGSGTSLDEFAAKALLEHQYAIFSVTKDFPLVSELLKDAPAQYGHRSVWLTVNKIEGCNVCGPNPGKPMIDVAPNVDDLKAAIQVAEILVSKSTDNV